MQYLIEKTAEITQDYLSKVMLDFQTRVFSRLQRYWKYYQGNQKIMQKQPTDAGKPCNKIVTNFCYNIAQNYQGYLTGKAIKYRNDDFKDVIDILNYNDVEYEDSELLRQALIFGVAYEINYIDEDGKQRFKTLDSRQCIPVYSNSLNNELLYVIRFYSEDLINRGNENYIVEVYGPNSTKYYRSSAGFLSFEFIDEIPNYFGQCPVNVFSLNADEESIFAQVLTLQDGYNNLVSDEVDDVDAFADAYLILKGVIADPEDLVTMKQNRVLMLDNDSDASYLTKTISDTQIENMLTNFETQIYKITNCPNFSDEKFFAQSGIALRYKLVGFENIAANIEKQMRKCLQRRIENICAILYKMGNEQSWRDVEIIFSRNLPDALTPSTPAEVMQYQGLVSKETLLNILPFIDNADEELARVEKENEASMELFGRGHEDEELLAE